MTTRLNTRTQLLAAVTALAVLSGCTPGGGQTDSDPGIVGDLKIEIPKSATNIVGHTDSGVDFLIPNDQWRDYATKYYPGKALSERPSKEVDGSVPAMCIPAFRAGTKLSHWIAGENIQSRDNRLEYRFISVTPDCEPGKAFVQWRLSDPE
ncbi:hypothetical protein BST43_09665 [Mycobacteroides saopaulense]|uniref:Lipoprotein n=1 Tax=Mycobacteroides saopaulense TaxID=1578165 RepID=A0A1X0J8G0_9MYCO|nr:hypothetical protein [Mycobacteroides saopaulense]ORB58659.1 hypothetical protein BST43_09665 [Mycobacteroides saopaulense]